MIVVDVKYFNRMDKRKAEELVGVILTYFRNDFGHTISAGDYSRFNYDDGNQPGFLVLVNIAESTIGDLEGISNRLIHLASQVVPEANIVLLLQGGRGVVSHTRTTDISRVAGQ